MTDLEDRLRRDLKDFSERIAPGPVRPLREPQARRRSAPVRWLAPAAAAVAVLGVIAGVSLAGPSGSGPAPVFTKPGGPMPPFYVTVWQTYNGSNNGRAIPTFAAVHDSATGAALATVRVPTLTDAQGGTQGPSITAAGDDRTFVIMEQSDVPRVNLFYRLRVAANGRSVKLSRLPVSLPGYLSLTDVALSPDGTRLAMDVQHCNAKTESCPYTGIRVVTLASGAVSTWTTRANGAPFDVSWVGNERVAFEWQAGVSTPPPGQQTGYRLLALTGAGRDLMASRPIGSPPPGPDQSLPPALVTPDGKVVITSVGAKIMELSARTGLLLRVLYKANGIPGQVGCRVLSLARSGINVLVSCFAFGRLDGSRFTPLPGFPSPSSSGISGQRAAAW